MKKKKINAINKFNERKRIFNNSQLYLDAGDFDNFNLNTPLKSKYGISLSGISFIEASFYYTNLSNTNLSHLNLQGARFYYSNLERSKFVYSLIGGAKFSGSSLNNMCYYYNKKDILDKINFSDVSYTSIITDSETLAIIEYGIAQNITDYDIEHTKRWLSSCTMHDYFFSKIQTNLNNKNEFNKHIIKKDNHYNEDLAQLMISLSNNLQKANKIQNEYESDKKKSLLIMAFISETEKLDDDDKSLQFFDLSRCSFNPEYKTTYYQHNGYYCCFNNYNFIKSNLDCTDFSGASLINANFSFSDITNSKFENCNLDNSSFNNICEFNNTSFKNSSMKKTDLMKSVLTNINLINCKCNEIRIEDTSFNSCDLTNMIYTPNPSDTLSKITFNNSQYKNALLTPHVLSFIDYNIKKQHWIKWYKSYNLLPDLNYYDNLINYFQHNFFTTTIASILIAIYFLLISIVICVKSAILIILTYFFWLISDYGYSTARLIGVFFAVTIIFTILYCYYGSEWLNIFLNSKGEQIELSNWESRIRCFYYSIVTMTTLGFGDIIPKVKSISGYIAVSIQVLFGYGLLGALITRIGVLFTSNSPSVTPKNYFKSQK